jgi:molybdate transport system substrate-binding protein
MLRRWFLGAVIWTGLAASAPAADIHVMISGGFSEAYRELVPAFEKATGHTVVTAYGPSMGTSDEAIPNRLSRGEPADVLIMVGYALDELAAKSQVVAASRVELARSRIGAAVRKGAAHPDISTVEALKQALLQAKSVAYSDSASGVYVSGELFQKLGIAAEMKGKARKIIAERVGNVVARGEAELGFQQISELKPIAGIDLLGPLPPEVQKITIFSAGVAAKSEKPDVAKQLISFLSSKEAGPAIAATGLDP